MSSRDATHYQHDVEVIDAIEAWGLNYRLGNVVKYVARAGEKGDRRGDLIKALDYLHREITGEWHEPLPNPYMERELYCLDCLALAAECDCPT